MQFLTALFGGTGNAYLNSAFALGIVLVLIVLGLWILKQVTRTGVTVNRGQHRRLSVVDSANVDGKRQVLIIRRDNVEHLIMTGGPQDLVIESGIPAPEVVQPRRAQRPQANSAPAADIATPAPEHSVSREAIDRLRDLVRPAPLRPQPSLRRTGLMRPDTTRDSPVIPIGPALRVDNSAGAPSDSATTGAGDGTGGQSRFGGKNRFFRGGFRGDRP